MAWASLLLKPYQLLKGKLSRIITSYGSLKRRLWWVMRQGFNTTDDGVCLFVWNSIAASCLKSNEQLKQTKKLRMQHTHAMACIKPQLGNSIEMARLQSGFIAYRKKTNNTKPFPISPVFSNPPPHPPPPSPPLGIRIAFWSALPRARALSSARARFWRIYVFFNWTVSLIVPEMKRNEIKPQIVETLIGMQCVCVHCTREWVCLVVLYVLVSRTFKFPDWISRNTSLHSKWRLKFWQKSSSCVFPDGRK